MTDFLLPSHMGKEPACGMAMEKLGLEASIYGNLALGEGTGAVMLFPLFGYGRSCVPGKQYI